MKKWVVTDLDNDRVEFFDKKEEAVLDCRASFLDYRKRTVVKKISDGIYEYIPPRDSSNKKSLYICKANAAVKKGYFESEESLVKFYKDWERLQEEVEEYRQKKGLV